MFKLVLAGGGTGGHLFPGLAVAGEFTRRDPETQVLLVGTGRPIEKEIMWPDNFSVRRISAGGLKGASLRRRLKSLARLPIGLIQSMSLLNKFKPDLVFCLGGYSAGPVGVASKLLGVPSALHEQNSVPGLTNRLLGRLVNLVFISFESAGQFFNPNRTHLTGNPVRREIITAQKKKIESGRPFSILVAGGSQGAHAVNMAMVEAVRILYSGGTRIRILHQSGTADLAELGKAYNDMGADAEVKAFIRNMAEAYVDADLVVCRAGALTVAEIALVGLPAIFIPLPVADGHQEKNARSLEDVSAAEVIGQKDLTPQLLADRISALIQDRDRLREMGENAATAAKPKATEEICDICLDFLNSGSRGK